MKKDATPLRKGYTTGVHASFAFASALEGLLATQTCCHAITYKMDNDDIDITKGCEIVISLSFILKNLTRNPIMHLPYEIGKLKLYAGLGVGIVTKEGLKPPQGYPAINPVPLDAIAKIYHRLDEYQSRTIYATISITDGEVLAKQTANTKVGVLGGLSILGTTGIVKPISSAAYIDSIATEIGFIKANGYDKVVFTLGNSSLAEAKKSYKEEQIIEIGNFVYDAIEIAQSKEIHEILFVCGIGKATKVMQGHKNTHNRFGSIDFEALKLLIAHELHVSIDTEVTKTVKGITRQLGEKSVAFYNLVKHDTEKQIKQWFPNISVETMIVR